MNIGVVGNRRGWELLDVKKYLIRLNVNEEDVIFTGGAIGVDSFAVNVAKEIGADVQIFHPRRSLPVPERFFERNRRIVDAVEYLIAFDLKSKTHSGTRYTINYALKLKKPLKLIDSKT